MPAGIQITHVGRQRRDGIVGALLNESLPFRVTENGKPVPDEWVTVDSDPEGAGVFPPSDESYATVQTDKSGIARVQFRPSREGEFSIRATVRGETKGVYRMTVTRNAGHQMLGPNIVDARRSRSGTDVAKFAWPIAAVLMAIAFAILFAKWIDKPSAPAPTPQVIYPSGGGSTHDATARANAEAALAKANELDGAKASREELTEGLAVNSQSDRAYGREYSGRLYVDSARRIAQGLKENSASDRAYGREYTERWVPSMCRRNPELPTCRRLLAQSGP